MEIRVAHRSSRGHYAKKAVLKYKGNSDQSFKLGYVAAYPENPGYSEKWLLAENSEYLQSCDGANGSLVSKEITGLPEKIRNAHQAGSSYIYLSFKASTDFMNTPLVTFSELYLEITYEVRISITADNNFTDNLGQGKHGWILEQQAGRQPAPFTFQRLTGESTVLEVETPQTDNEGYERRFHQGSVNKSVWWKIKGTSQTEVGNNTTLIINQISTNEANVTYQAQFRQVRVTTAGSLSTDETWFTPVTLIGNVIVPPGRTLNITSDATVNLGGYSIVSTGGNINITGTFTNLRAKLKDGYGNNKGYSGTVQSAVDNAGTSYQVEVQSGTFTENISFTGKNSLTIKGLGVSQSNIQGTITAYSSPYLNVSDLTCRGVSVNNCTSPLITNTINPGGGYSNGLATYNSDAVFKGNASTAYVGCSSVSSTLGVLCRDGLITSINNGGYGVSASSNSNVTLYRDYLNSSIEICGNYYYELTASSGASITAYNCKFPGGVARYTGNVFVSSPLNCSGLLKSSEYEVNAAETLIPDNEFKTINDFYFELSNKVSEEPYESRSLNSDKFKQDYQKNIDNFKTYMDNNLDSKHLKASLATIIQSFKHVGNEEMKDFLQDVLKNKKLSSIENLAKKYMIDYYVNDKNFDEALKTADEVFGATKDPDLQTEILYTKGLILSHDLNKSEEASECFNSIMNNYPESALSSFAANELLILGYPAEKETLSKVVSNGELETNNYPNPFNPTTIINYTLPSDEYVTLKIFDVLGSEITTLVNENKKAGTHTVSFDGSNLSSGVYFYTISAGANSISKKIILAK